MTTPMRTQSVRPPASTGFGFGFEATMREPAYRFREWHDRTSLLATPAAAGGAGSGPAA